MTIDEINIHITEKLAKKRSEKDYKKYLEDFFQDYERIVSTLTVEEQQSQLPNGFTLDDLQKEVSDSISALLEAYNSYSEGKVISAINTMCKQFVNDSNIRTICFDSSVNWYRVRKREERGSGFLPKEMFHIPFDKRTDVVNYRYSISGYPCLYLGNSILTCWEEMACPALDDIVVSKVKLKERETFTVLDLRMPKLPKERPLFSDKEKDGMKRDNLQLLRAWPLIIACSIKTITPEASFKHEYVHPQLLMLALRESKSDMYGIAYTSTHIDTNIDDDVLSYTNVAIPVRKVKAAGYCKELSEKFSLTRGVSFMEADLKNVFGPEFDEMEETLSFSDNSNIKFKQLERYLDKIKLEEISDE